MQCYTEFPDGPYLFRLKHDKNGRVNRAPAKTSKYAMFSHAYSHIYLLPP